MEKNEEELRRQENGDYLLISHSHDIVDNDNPQQRKCRMPTENIYDLYITDRQRNIILEERSIAVHTAERIARDYPWRNSLQTNAQFWKQNTKFSFSIITLNRQKSFRWDFPKKRHGLNCRCPMSGQYMAF